MSLADGSAWENEFGTGGTKVQEYMVTYKKLVVGEHFRETKEFSKVLSSQQIKDLLANDKSVVIKIMKELK